MSLIDHFRFVLLCSCFFLSSNVGVANQRIDSRKKTVDRFLHAWLVRKDISTALQFFSRRALRDASVLNAHCTDYILEKDRANPAGVKRGVTNFLFESSRHIRGASL